jgi:hypothetical protein
LRWRFGFGLSAVLNRVRELIPNPETKYGVGENAGMSLDPAGGIAIHVTAKLAYHECVAESVARFEGFVAKYIGDGVPT